MSSLVFSNFHPAKITDKSINQVLLDLIELTPAVKSVEPNLGDFNYAA